MAHPPNPAETYEHFMVPVLFAPWASRIVDLADPRPDERILDVACGTGIVARTVAARAGDHGSITGLDISPAMLEVARVAAARAGQTIRWIEGRAEDLPFRDNAFDVVFCQFALMFFTDRPAALAEMHRVLADGGRLAVAVWQGIEHHPFYQTLHEVIEHRIGRSAMQDIFVLGDAGELRSLVAGAGFHGIEHRSVSMTARFPGPDDFIAGEIDVDTAAIPAMQSLDAGARAAITAAIRDDIAPALKDATEGDAVVLPFHAHLLLAWR